MSFIDKNIPQNRILMFTNQAGGGHIQSVEAMKSQIETTNSKIQVQDILKMGVGNYIGSKLYNNWNKSAKNENFKKFAFVLKFQALGELFLVVPIFIKTTYSLISSNIICVINPQPVVIPTLVRAVRLANFINKFIFRRKETIFFYQVITELPNKEAANFFRPLKGLFNGDRKICRLVAAAPLLEQPEQTAEEFWKKHTGFSAKQVINYLPIRQAFEKYAKIDPVAIKKIDLEGRNDAAYQRLCSILKDTNADIKIDLASKKIKYRLSIHDTVHALMLGSQASLESTKKYVRNVIETVQTDPKKDGKRVLFVFCGNDSGKNSLFKQICEIIEQEKKEGTLPANLIIAPLESQDAECMAGVMRKAQSTLTRSGGLTSMELLKNKPVNIFIHTLEEDLEKGMPSWEAGNARYLEKMANAQFTTTENTALMKQFINGTH